RHMDLVDRRRFEIGQYWIKLTKASSSKNWLPDVSGRRPVMDTFGHAVKVLDKIRFDNPTGKLADDATMAAAVANFEKGKYGAADILFTDVRENFPKSDHLFEAYLLGLKSKLAMYEGPDYSGVVLDEAEGLVRTMMRPMFRREVKGHEEYLSNALKDIRLKKANREYSMAKFYDNRKEYGAARLYYNRVRQEYPDTNLALESENRLAAIASYPDAPEENLEFIAKWFPEDEGRAKPLLARKTVDTKVR
ncbi:MAG: outer membrane protein assembly factor BamD, partial [Planctomycetota bacterium]